MGKKMLFGLFCIYYINASEEINTTLSDANSIEESPSFLSCYFPCFQSNTHSLTRPQQICMMSICCGCISCYTCCPYLTATEGCIECTRGACFLASAAVASLNKKSAFSPS